MSTATLTSKGQITLPQSVRQTASACKPVTSSILLRTRQREASGSWPCARQLHALRGRFAGRIAEPVSLEEMARPCRPKRCAPRPGAKARRAEPA